ncbi:MAG TPA: hypothetical protein DCX32_01105 [Candidatus Moranbacteria bacterium]|nr:MAG: hypothetical protein UW87_C0002G0055 [Candidatus Moranbacteria bacterium GW2011_GWC2_45_10]KKT95224.1 MAG: hypothetical protein UW95_C0003G0066 [Parcubacteria group bacterium GW2011_GWC1_45_14]HAV11129.1 hypothetical protein [Candidatus Moranbacteria bacterium]
MSLFEKIVMWTLELIVASFIVSILFFSVSNNFYQNDIIEFVLVPLAVIFLVACLGTLFEKKRKKEQFGLMKMIDWLSFVVFLISTGGLFLALYFIILSSEDGAGLLGAIMTVFFGIPFSLSLVTKTIIHWKAKKCNIKA